MVDDPVVETINAILNGEDNFILLLQRPQLERIRDEILALRDENIEMRRTFGSHPLFKEARDEALEEAAHECDEEAKGSGGEVAFRDGCETCAAAIRLLKEREP